MGLPCGIAKRLPREIAERYLACGYLTGAKSASKKFVPGRVHSWFVYIIHHQDEIFVKKVRFSL
jgi:hypothetical protein